MNKLYIILCCCLIALSNLTARSIVIESIEDVLPRASSLFKHSSESSLDRPTATTRHEELRGDKIHSQNQVPCSTAPIGGTTVSNTPAVCIGTTISLSVINGTAGVTELSYQWQSSTDNINWTNLSGEINSEYSNLVVINNSAYYRREISCGVLTSYSTGLLISVSSLPDYASLPFNEGFETAWQSLCNSSRGLPSNSWRNLPLTGANSWRRDDDGISAGWSSPDFVTWPGGANGTLHSAVFHSSRVPLGLVGDLSVYVDCSTGLSSKELKFNYISGDSLRILLSTDGGSSFTMIGELGQSSLSWKQQIIGFNSSSATTIIRFSGKKTAMAYYDIELDDVSIVAVPCFAPSLLQVKPLLNAANFLVKPSALSNPDGYEYAVTTSNSPPASGTFTSNTTGTVTGLSASTNYVMHIRSTCIAKGNSSWISQPFKTATANCIPPYNNDCVYGSSYKIRDFELKGENNTLISKTAISCTQGGYYDFTGISNVTMAQGKSYSCMALTDTSSTLDIWIDLNDDGAFTYNEKVLDRFVSESKSKNFISLFIPENANPGPHRFRIGMNQSDPCREVYYGPGQAQDYTVTIVAANAGAAHTISSGQANNCLNGGNLTINEASNNNTAWVPLMDTDNNTIASVNANGNNLNRVDVYEYINTGTTRKTTDDKFYLNRNIQISVGSQPLTSVGIRIYMLQSEFDALKAADPSIQNWSDLWMTKTAQPCGSILGSGLLLQPVGTGNATNGFYVEYNVPSFSSFFFHKSSSALPVKLKKFNATRKGAVNHISWTTATEFNNVGFQIEESKDGINFTNLSFVASKAIDGNSSSELDYVYDSQSANEDTYYRLKQVDNDGHSNSSATVFVKIPDRRKMTLNRFFPNPVGNLLVLDLSSTINDKLSIIINGVSSNTLLNYQREIHISRNQIKINVSGLPAGMYLIKVKSKTTGEQVINKFLKF